MPSIITFSGSMGKLNKKDIISYFEALQSIFKVLSAFIIQLGETEKKSKEKFEKTKELLDNPEKAILLVGKKYPELSQKFMEFFLLMKETAANKNLLELSPKEKIAAGKKLDKANAILSEIIQELKKVKE